MQTILLDSSIFLDYLLETEKRKTARVVVMDILSGKNQGVLSAIALTEIKYRIMKLFGHDKAEEAIFLIKNSSNLKIVPMSEEIAENAADVRFKYYGRNKNEMSYADAIHIATALKVKCDMIITSDADFEPVSEIKVQIY